MAAGTVQAYNGAYEELMDDANTQWDAAAAGSFMFVLAYGTYTPSDADITLNNVGVADTDWISTGDGAPINATTRAVTATVGTTGLLSDTANFGDPVTITDAKYLICVRPLSAGTAELTSRLIFYVELESGSTVSSVAAEFTVSQPSGGWLTFNQA